MLPTLNWKAEDLAGTCSTAVVEREEILAKTLGQVLVSEMCQIFKVHSE